MDNDTTAQQFKWKILQEFEFFDKYYFKRSNERMVKNCNIQIYICGHGDIGFFQLPSIR